MQYANKELALAAAAQALSTEITTRLHTNTQLLLLVSGGSAFHVLEHVDIPNMSSLLTVGVLDERYSPDPQINNYSQLTETNFFQFCIGKGVQFIDTRVDLNDSSQDIARRFENRIRGWVKNNPTGKIVITQGIGPDGHTAGILPFADDPSTFASLFLSPDRWVVAYDAQYKNPYRFRITTTLTFLKYVDVSIVFVCGSDKLIAWKELQAPHGELNHTPARIIHEMKNVQIFTDL